MNKCKYCGKVDGILSKREDYYLCWQCANFSNNLKKYNLTIDQYRQRLEEQQFKCKICRIPAIYSRLPGPVEKYGLVVDHCHATQHVRGLICNRCNTVIGLCVDNPYILSAAVHYLKNNNN